MSFRRQGLVVVLLLGAVWTTGCARKPGERPFWKFWAPRQSAPKAPAIEIPAPPEVAMPNTPLRALEPPKPPASAAAEPGDVKRAPATVIQPALRTVYFEYDSAQLTDESKEVLRQNAQWLREHAQIEVQVQGHCDERGTVEYNFNLGQRRAEAVKSFLVNLGVTADRIHTISYGEERPAVEGHNEEAWRLNRRVEFHAY
jgi:peptidoglycan-associated lipoprotein